MVVLAGAGRLEAMLAPVHRVSQPGRTLPDIPTSAPGVELLPGGRSVFAAAGSRAVGRTTLGVRLTTRRSFSKSGIDSLDQYQEHYGL